MLMVSCSEDKNTNPDTEPPTVMITYPANNSTFMVSTSITITAEAEDNEGNDEVKFYIDGELEGIDNSEPYNETWNLPSESGDHTIIAEAIDDAGNSNYSNQVNVHVAYENEPPSTPFNPQPTNNSINNSVISKLVWNCNDPENDTLRYDVYFGETNEPELVNENTYATEYTINGLLEYGNTYYWKIDAEDSFGNITEGELWVFDTIISSSNSFIRLYDSSSPQCAIQSNDYYYIFAISGIFSIDLMGNYLSYFDYDGFEGYVTNCIKTNNGEFVLVGSESDCFSIFKLDSNLNLIWKTNVESGYGVGIANAVIESYDGFVATGMHNQDHYIAKFDLLGNVIWEYHYVGQIAQGTSICETGDNNYITCVLYGGGANPNPLITKIDVNGNLIWANFYPEFRGFYALVKLNDNTFCVVGENVDNNFAFLKIDQNGNIVWSNSYPSYSGYDEAKDLCLIDDEILIVGDYSFGVLLLRVDYNGTIIEENILTTENVNNIQMNNPVIDITDDNGFILGSQNNWGTNRIILIKADTNGNFY